MGYISHFDLLKALGYMFSRYMCAQKLHGTDIRLELRTRVWTKTSLVWKQFKFVIAVDLNEQIILHYFILHVCTYCCALSGSAMAVTNVNFVNYLLRNKFIDKVKVVFRCKAPQSTCLSFIHSSTHSDLSLWSVCNLCFMLLYVFSLILWF